ncbi:Carboxypeptidase A2 [Armadillidium vulgare]|nr:Carboxypeptidase A2 [Armadillidium vulgare]
MFTSDEQTETHAVKRMVDQEPLVNQNQELKGFLNQNRFQDPSVRDLPYLRSANIASLWLYEKYQACNSRKVYKNGSRNGKHYLQKYKNPYRVLQASAIGAAAGGSDDWAFIKMKIPYSYTFELQDRVNIRYQFTSRGFILPARKLLQAVDECWLGMKYLGEQILLEQGLAHRIVDLPPSPVSINGEEDYESGEAEGEEQEREEPYISAYPFGLEQVIKEVQGLQAEIEQRNLNEKKENCVERAVGALQHVIQHLELSIFQLTLVCQKENLYDT